MARDVIEAFKQVFHESGKTPYRVALDAGIKHAMYSDFSKASEMFGRRRSPSYVRPLD